MLEKQHMKLVRVVREAERSLDKCLLFQLCSSLPKTTSSNCDLFSLPKDVEQKKSGNYFFLDD